MNFQEICRAIDNNVCLDEGINYVHVKTNGNAVNNALINVLFNVNKKDVPKGMENKDYKLSFIHLGEEIYNLIKQEFELDDPYKLFGILALLDETIPKYNIRYGYSWTVFEMGTKPDNK